jgi:uncharacterized membrane protein
MFCSIKNPAIQRLYRRTFVFILLSVPLNILTALGFVLYHITGVLAWLLAVLPALPTVGYMVSYGLYLTEEKDEFMRTVQMQSMVGGIGATLAATTIWGYMEKYVHAPHLDLIWLYLIFWGFAGISYGVVKLRYR